MIEVKSNLLNKIHLNSYAENDYIQIYSYLKSSYFPNSKPNKPSYGRYPILRWIATICWKNKGQIVIKGKFWLFLKICRNWIKQLFDWTPNKIVWQQCGAMLNIISKSKAKYIIIIYPSTISMKDIENEFGSSYRYSVASEAELHDYSILYSSYRNMWFQVHTRREYGPAIRWECR